MFARLIRLCSAALFVCALTASLPAPTLAANDGIVRVKSAYPMGETIARLKKDIADKGIKFFDEIDQSKLAADAGIRPTLWGSLAIAGAGLPLLLLPNLAAVLLGMVLIGVGALRIGWPACVAGIALSLGAAALFAFHLKIPTDN
jgi:hypothetical protein